MELTLSIDDGPSRLAITIVHERRVPMRGDWQLNVMAREIRSPDAWVDAWVERNEGRAVAFNNSDNSMTLSIPGTAR